MFSEEATSAFAGFHAVPQTWSNLEFGCVSFLEGGKQECLEKTFGARTRSNNTFNPHMALGWNQTRSTLVVGGLSHHRAIPAPHKCTPSLHPIPSPHPCSPSLYPIPAPHPCSPSLLPIPAPDPCSPSLLPIPAPHPCTPSLHPSLLPIPAPHPYSLLCSQYEYSSLSRTDFCTIPDDPIYSYFVLCCSPGL